ncbi:hypothetical protein ABMA27_001334 [Loxostege sticticalis]|uniref:FLYWCH-type domain-containing protein n=1 Tax=Loxostege sticticalis TaxID=481309 RepID=A0ABR3HY34_LOXSC
MVVPLPSMICGNEFMPSRRGNGRVLVYQGYTYANMGYKNRWYCSKKNSGCKARLNVDIQLGEVEAFNEHHHDKPVLYRNGKGELVRLRS